MENNNLAYIVNEHGSTHRCSVCGSKNVQIDDREFLCLNCMHKDDRDINAAKNILKFGWETLAKVLRKGAGADVSQPELPMMRLMPLKVEAPSVRAE